MKYKKVTKPGETRTITEEPVNGYEITYYAFNETERKPVLVTYFVNADWKRTNETIKETFFRNSGIRDETFFQTEQECIDGRIKKAILSIASANNEIERLKSGITRNEILIEAIAENDEAEEAS